MSRLRLAGAKVWRRAGGRRGAEAAISSTTAELGLPLEDPPAPPPSLESAAPWQADPPPGGLFLRQQRLAAGTRAARQALRVDNPGALLTVVTSTAFQSGVARFRGRTVLAPVAPQIHPALVASSLAAQPPAENRLPPPRPRTPRGETQTPIPRIPPAWIGYDAARVPRLAPRTVPREDVTPVPRLSMGGWRGDDAVRVPRAAGAVPSREDAGASPQPLIVAALDPLPPVPSPHPLLPRRRLVGDTVGPIPRISMGGIAEADPYRPTLRPRLQRGTVDLAWPLLGALGLLPDVSEGRPRLLPRRVPQAAWERLDVLTLGALAEGGASLPLVPRARPPLTDLSVWPEANLAVGPALALLPEASFWARLRPEVRPQDLTVSVDPLDLRSHPAQTGVARFLGRVVLAPVTSGQAQPLLAAAPTFSLVDGVQYYLRPRARHLPGDIQRGDAIRLAAFLPPDLGFPPSLGRRPQRPRLDLSVWPLRPYAAPGLTTQVLGEYGGEHTRRHRLGLYRTRTEVFRPAAPIAVVSLLTWLDPQALAYRTRLRLPVLGPYAPLSVLVWPLVVPASFHQGERWQYLAGDTAFTFDLPAGHAWSSPTGATDLEAPYTVVVWLFPPGRTTWEF